MILVLSGTKDGRELAQALLSQGFSILTTAVSEYGGQLLSEDGLEVMIGALTQEDLTSLINDKSIQAIVDATHPYAKAVSQMAIAVAENQGKPYYRYERPGVLAATEDVICKHTNQGENIQNGYGIHRVANVIEAAQMASQLGKQIFLTIGSNQLGDFLASSARECQVTARVLPDPRVLAKCFALGLKPEQIIAMQGPFSEAMNSLMFTEKQAEVVVTKDSGQVGGTDAKLTAAARLGIPVVVIERPGVVYPRIYQDKVELINILKGEINQ